VFIAIVIFIAMSLASCYRRLWGRLLVALWLAGLGDINGRIHLRRGDAAAAVEMVRTTLSLWHAPELWRVRGELLAARGEPSDAVESSFGRALEIARAQAARAFELRAATALARQLAARGRKGAARATLAPPYEAFTEGLDTADLRAARTLLRELGG